MIQKLYNPKTDFYKYFKDFILGPHFGWHWLDESTPGYEKEHHENLGHYSHSFLMRSAFEDRFYPKTNSAYIEQAQQLFLEIARANKIEPYVIYRMNANAVHPTSSMKYSVPHHDHKYPHKNMLVYLTDPSGGDTVCEGESFLAEEDDVIIMEGEHCHKPPHTGRRVVLVYTFLDHELIGRCYQGLNLLKNDSK